MPNLFSRYLAVAALTVAVLALAAGALVVVGERAGRQAFTVDGPVRLEWLVETGAAWRIEQAAAQPGGAWRTWDGKGALMSKAGAGETFWLRVTLHNPGGEPLLGVLQDSEIYTDNVDLWVKRDDGSWRHERAGESVAQRDRPWRQFSPAFRVTVPAGGETVVYVRETDYFYAMSRWWWWPRDADYFSNLGLETLVKGCAFGALAALLIYNLVLWLRLRFPDTGWYVGYAASMLLFNLSETGALAVIGELVTPFWRHRVETTAMAASGLFVISFARVFLETDERLPRLDRALRLMILGWAVFLVAGIILPWGPVDLWLGVGIFGVLLTHTVLLVAAIVVWRRGLRAARFFVAAFGLLYASGLPAAITWQGDGDTSGVILGILVCSVLEMVLLSFAIADRFAQTQRRLVEETEQRRLIEETYAEELALEVRERTRELEAANADKDRMLTVIGHDLRSPLTGLMKSADQPAADFARETARTGRTLLLMIEDLVLWARMRAGTREIAAYPAQALLQPAVALHRALADQGGTELVLEVPSDLRVETDLVLAQTLVRNLLANALRFARSRVVLRAEAVGADVRFTVSNDGAALPAEIVARLASNRDEPVTATGGLGLRLCREICAGLGTRLDGGVPAEGGAAFSFVLPAAVKMEEESA